MSKRPSFQFYPADWRVDSGLRLCSIAARGLWIEMMCLMHEAEPYGFLAPQKTPLTPDGLARLCGERVEQVAAWLEELRINGVYSTDENGVIFSRRMVRDEAVRQARAAGGHLGGEHGFKGGEHGKKGGRPRKTPQVKNGRGVFNPPPSSSSSSPSPSEEKDSYPDGTTSDVGSTRERRRTGGAS